MNEDTIEFEDDSVSFDEVQQDREEESILSKAGRAVLYVFLALFPLWFLPTTIAPVEFNKGYFAAVALLVSFMLTLGGILQEGRIYFVRSRFFSFSLLFIFTWLVASLFSASPLRSLWGTGFEATTFASVLFFGIILFLLPLALRDSRQLQKAFWCIMISLIASVLFFFVQSIWGLDVFRWAFAQERSFHPFGSWSSVSVLFGLGVALLLPFFGSSMSWFGRVSQALFFVLLVGMVFSNFPQVWVGIGIVSLFFVALSLSQREQRSKVFAVSLFLLLFAVLFFLLNDAVGEYFKDRFGSFGRQLEAILLPSTTFDILKQTIASSPFIGAGPNNFGFMWERFKDPAVNTSIFWQVRFNVGGSTFMTLVTEGGLINALALVLLIGLFIWQGIRAIAEAGGEDMAFVRSSFSGALFLLVLWFLYPLSFALMVLTFIMIGFFFVSLRDEGVAPAMNINLFATRERGFVFSLLIIFLLVGGVGGLYYETIRYLGQVAFGRGIEIYNTKGSINTAELEIKKAYGFDTTQDRYFRAYAQLELLKIQRALNDKSLSNKERQERIAGSYNEALRAAKTAVEIGKNDPVNYRLRGQVYETAIPISGSEKDSISKLALADYEKARSLSPADASLLVDLARAHLTIANVTAAEGGGSSSRAIVAAEYAKAIDFLTQAVALKPDYSEAHFTLAQLYVSQNEIDKAIKSTLETLQLQRDDIGVLFQLGLLYYQKGELAQSRVAFERAIEKNPNYSNAKYFLGLIYDRERRAADSLRIFEEIAVLNPDNQEVKNIIKALQEGKKASDALAVPPPEARKEAPLKEKEPAR